MKAWISENWAVKRYLKASSRRNGLISKFLAQNIALKDRLNLLRFMRFMTFQQEVSNKLGKFHLLFKCNVLSQKCAKTPISYTTVVH